jgi:hypothetical protein
MQITSKVTLFVLTSSLAFSTVASSSVEEVWTCKLNEGKEIEAVHKANSDWVKRINGGTDVGEIGSSTIVAVVGNQENFLFVDSYPSLGAWAAAKEFQESTEGEELFKEITEDFKGLFDCASNRLYESTAN